ncbi:glycerate kinase type-2 family protein [Aggregatilinea lenta]|uniref:glycerate kinase type-2 family protein n=1 Tax=Aggregatilinea lenta TaxID=913108 RepID=UPI001EE7CB59|nr:glycerate kinase [Aggregatilinea lenta]
MARFLKPDVQGDMHRQQALDVLGAALDAVDPGAAVLRALHRDGAILDVGGRRYDLDDYDHVWIVGAGKAGAPMAQAAEAVLGDRLNGGHVVVKTGYALPTATVRLWEAAHPVPDEAGLQGAQRIADLLRGAGERDLVLCLLSGGGSALLTLPVEGVTLGDIQALTQTLLLSGAPIQAINTLRKHLSQVKGGQLARLAHPATLVALILSDVVGSPLDVIASGPTVPDTSTFADAQAILDEYGIRETIPDAIRRTLDAGAAGRIPDTPKPGDPTLASVHNTIVADNAIAAGAAVGRAEALGFHTLLLSTFVEGEAREVAKVTAALAKEIVTYGRPVPRPACLILGGETTVTVRGEGKGGRNQELALAAALGIAGWDDVLIAALATDGSDGPTDAAGGLVDGSTVTRGSAQGLDARAALAANDAYPYLAQVGDLLITGPTNTNVNDITAIFVF